MLYATRYFPDQTRRYTPLWRMIIDYCLLIIELELRLNKKSVFFARLKGWMACLLPSGGRRRILRLSLLKKQNVSSTPSRAKTVLTCATGTRVKKISAPSVFSVAKNYFLCGYMFSQKYQVMQNKPNFRNAKNTITLAYTMTNNDEQRTMNYLKQTQSNPTSVMAVMVGWGLLSAVGGLPHHFLSSRDTSNQRRDTALPINSRCTLWQQIINKLLAWRESFSIMRKYCRQRK
jgi:hypothetical protein